MAVPQTSTEITAELTALYAARATLAQGGQVAEVWREGRRVTYSRVNLRELNDYIAQREVDLAKAEAVEAGRPARRAIGAYF